MTTVTARPRVRRRFRRAAIVAFVLLLPVALHSLWDYIETRRLVREIEAIIARGEPVTEQQAGLGYRKLSPEEDLAARHYLAAAHLGQPAVRADRSSLARLRMFIAGQPPNDFNLAAAAARLAVQWERGHLVFPLVDLATSLPFKGFSAGTDYSYRTSELLDLLALQAARTAHLSLTGAGDEAVGSAITNIQSRRIMQNSFDWMRAHDMNAPVVLSFGRASPAALARYQQALEAQEPPDLFEQAVLRDRAGFIDRVFTHFYAGDASAPRRYGTISYGRQNAGLANTLWRPWFTRRVIETLHGWNELVEASRLPWPDKARTMEAVYARFNQPRRPRLPFSSEQLSPRRSWWLPDNAAFFSTAMMPREFTGLIFDRASIVAIAVMRYRLEHGKVPSRLDDLRGTHLSAVPIDPYTGGGLRLKADPESFTVYSVGPDARDDGGDLVSALREREERGWGTRQLRGNDVGIRVLINQEERVK